MWRRWGDYVYAILVLSVFAVETAALTALTLMFVGRAIGLVPYYRLFAVLLGVIVVTGLALLTVTAHVLVYAAASAKRDRDRDARMGVLSRALDRWVADPSLSLPGKLSREAGDALLDMREATSGPEGEKLGALAVRSGLVEGLVRRARSRRLGPKLGALEGLAKARAPEAIDALFDHLAPGESPVVRSMATRAVARTLPMVHDERRRHRLSRRFAGVLAASSLPVGVVDEALLLLEDAAEDVIHEMLRYEHVPPKYLSAALSGAGRLQLHGLAPRVATFVAHAEPDVRAHAIEAAERLAVEVPGLHESVVDAVDDPVEYVRLHAVRALPVLAGDSALMVLPTRLGDVSWFVRRAAAETLMTLGDRGAKELEEARATHADRYARAMARAVLTRTTLIPQQEAP